MGLWWAWWELWWSPAPSPPASPSRWGDSGSGGFVPTLLQSWLVLYTSRRTGLVRIFIQFYRVFCKKILVVKIKKSCHQDCLHPYKTLILRRSTLKLVCCWLFDHYGKWGLQNAGKKLLSDMKLIVCTAKVLVPSHKQKCVKMQFMFKFIPLIVPWRFFVIVCVF